MICPRLSLGHPTFREFLPTILRSFVAAEYDDSVGGENGTGIYRILAIELNVNWRIV